MRLFKSIIYIALILTLAINPLFGSAQYYSSGQDPASLKWNQINTDHFQVIYPVGFDSIAQYVLNVMEYGRALTIQTKKIEPKKISIILHNQTTVSNAEVAWAPSRMEFYTLTPQSTYSQEWYQQLAIHEYTHVIQISSMNQGLTNFLRYLFGEQITVAIFGIYVPFWFVEGDAVVSETALSKSGRGRDPNFEAEIRAQFLEIGAYSLEKASLGSYKDFVPDRYHIGYYLVGQGKAQYGKEMWNKPMMNCGRYPLAVVPFSRGIKSETGYTKKQFYIKTTGELINEWTQQLLLTKPNYYHAVTKLDSYINYTNNAFISDNKIFSLKEDYHDIGRFIMMDTLGNEEKLFTPGYYLSDYITIGGDLVCWSEYKYDPRWNYRRFNKIMLLNIKTGKKKTLIKKSRYFSPNISASGTQIAVIEIDELSKHSLVILDSHDGHIINQINSPDNQFIAHPSWSANEDKIVVEIMNEQGKGLALFDLKSKQVINVLPYGFTHIQYPTFWENYILFEAAYSGVMDLYAMDIRTKSIYKTTSTPFSESDYSISPNGKSHIMSSYSSKGKQIVIKNWDPKKWIPISEVKNRAYPLADILSRQEDTLLIPASIPTEDYEIKKYSKLGHLVNIHSWSPLHFDANNRSINPGISALSQNKLSTMTARIGADYNFNTESMRYYGNINYLGWYPVISLGGDYGKKFVTQSIDNNTVTHYYDEANFNAAISIPLLYTSGSWSFRIQAKTAYNYRKVYHNKQLNFSFDQLESIDYSIALSGSQKSPFQNIFPRWGYNLNIEYRNTPFNTNAGDMLNIGFASYLPGMFQHDGIRLMLHYQDKIDRAFFFNDYAMPARGYTGLSYTDMLTLRADYQVPILYPDWNLSSLIYFKRVIMGGFFDYSMLPNAPENTSYPNHYFWSSGLDFTTDVHFLRTKAPINIGFRMIYVNGYVKNPQAMVYQFLWSLNI